MMPDKSFKSHKAILLITILAILMPQFLPLKLFLSWRKWTRILTQFKKLAHFTKSVKKNLNWRNQNRRRLTDDEFILYNYINWLSLHEKGKLLLQAYKTDILPQISEVYSIQKEIEIKSDLGDVIGGKIDLIASFTDKPDVPFICDNKTSSTAYKEDSVRESEQLATYAEAEQNFNAAYLVVEKKLRVKEPRTRTQVIKDTIPVSTIEKTLDIYGQLCESIEAAGDNIENYPQNWDSCFDYGKVCAYYSICKHNNSEHLIDCKKPIKEEE